MHIYGCVSSCKVILADFISIYSAWEAGAIWRRGVLRLWGLCLWTLITKPVSSQGLVNLDKWSSNAGCCSLMPAENGQRLLDARQLRKFNLENTGQSLMRHPLSCYRVKWAHWQRMTSISLKTTWHAAQYNTMQHVADGGNLASGCTSLSLSRLIVVVCLSVAKLVMTSYFFNNRTFSG